MYDKRSLSLFRLHLRLLPPKFLAATVHHRTPPAMDDGKITTFTEHITTHGTTVLEVVYTNDPRTMERIIKKYEEWLKEEKNKFVGLDLEYTRKSSYIRQGITVVQLAMREHVLVYHYCRSERSQTLVDFLQWKAVTFTSVDTRNDKTMLARACIRIPDEHHVDIQRLFCIKGGGERDSMADLAAAIIDPSYKNMKKSFPKEKHQFWEWKPLSPIHLEYAAKDGYVSYELYHRILIIKNGLHHLHQQPMKERLRPRKSNDEGSSSGWKCRKGNSGW